ncbi:MAG: VWA domain-containing protein, partial [Acidobacteriota bacterium]
ADLAREDFRVLDNRQPVEIERWDNAPAGLSVVLVLDTSLTMEGEKLRAAIRAAEEFVEKLEPQDRVAALPFSDEPRIAASMTDNHDAAIESIAGLGARGGTALYDAIHHAADLLANEQPGFRRVAVVLSDGRDEAASGLEPGSFHTLDEAIRRAHRRDMIVFTIGLGKEVETEQDFTGKMMLSEVLERIAVSTGGRYVYAKRTGSLSSHYREILEELRHQYGLAYTPPAPRPGESWRPIQVQVDREGVSVRTREGYFVR